MRLDFSLLVKLSTIKSQDAGKITGGLLLKTSIKFAATSKVFPQSSHQGLLLNRTSDVKKHTVVIRHSQINNRGHTSGQAMANDKVQSVSPVVSRLLDMSCKIHTAEQVDKLNENTI